MISADLIHQKANMLVQRHETRDPIQIATEQGIYVYFRDDMSNLLGMYTNAFRNRGIFLNSRMDEPLVKMVLAHELGHDALHRERAKYGTVRKFDLLQLKDPSEYEANAFAAHLLLDTEEFMGYSRAEYDIEQIARTMSVVKELALIKWQELCKLDYEMNEPMTTNARFFRGIKV